MTSYVYRYNRETSLYEVGFYHPDQTWEPDVNLTENCIVTPGIAAARVAFLNGGDGDFDRDEMDQLIQRIDVLESKASDDRNDIDRLIQRVYALETKVASLDRGLSNTITKLIGGP
jgi:hypothetical protein